MSLLKKIEDYVLGLEKEIKQRDMHAGVLVCNWKNPIPTTAGNVEEMGKLYYNLHEAYECLATKKLLSQVKNDLENFIAQEQFRLGLPGRPDNKIIQCPTVVDDGKPDPIKTRIVKPEEIKTDDYVVNRVTLWIDDANHVVEVWQERQFDGIYRAVLKKD